MTTTEQDYQRDLPIEIKADIKEVGEDGVFSGIASAYGVEDQSGDVIDKGAFKKTLSENPTVRILWMHDSREVIGEGTLKEWQGKILVEARLDLDDPVAQKAYNKIKKGLIKGLSIGFNTVKQTWEEVEGKMIRHISELKLWEVSVVTFPCLSMAQITRVKNAEDESRLKALIEAEVAKQVQALKTAESTRETEPVPPVAEPPSSNEPDALHSWLPESLDNFKKALSAIQ